MTDATFRMQPAEVTDAGNQLDALATRIEKLMADETPNLVVNAPARDEVSQRAAATMNEVHTKFADSTDQGSNEIREIAAQLRAHTDNVVAADRDFVD